MTVKIAVVAVFCLFLQYSEGVSLHGVARRQARANPDWIVSSTWSDCTATCGGGIEVRSVRCLDTDDVISGGCDLQSRPESFRICAQIDCNSGAESVIQPIDGSYNPTNQPDGIVSMVLYTNTGVGTYTVEQMTTEQDGTMTQVSQERFSGGTQTNVRVSGRESDTFRIVNGENLILNDRSILNLNDADTVMIPSGQTFQYSQSTLTTPMGSIGGINMLQFFDGFRSYQFNSSKINDLPGPGTITFNAVSGEALYLPEGIALQQLIDAAIDALATPEPTTNVTLPPSTTPAPTVPPVETTEAPAVSTDPPTMQTDPPTVETDSPVVITDGPVIGGPDETVNRCQEGKSRSKKGRKGKKGKSKYEEEEIEMDCVENTKTRGKSDSRDEEEIDVSEIDIAGADESSQRSRSKKGRSRSRSESEEDTVVMVEEVSAANTRTRARSRSRSGPRSRSESDEDTVVMAEEEVSTPNTRSSSRSRSGRRRRG